MIGGISRHRLSEDETVRRNSTGRLEGNQSIPLESRYYLSLTERIGWADMLAMKRTLAGLVTPVTVVAVAAGGYVYISFPVRLTNAALEFDHPARKASVR